MIRCFCHKIEIIRAFFFHWQELRQCWIYMTLIRITQNSRWLKLTQFRANFPKDSSYWKKTPDAFPTNSFYEFSLQNAIKNKLMSLSLSLSLFLIRLNLDNKFFKLVYKFLSSASLFYRFQASVIDIGMCMRNETWVLVLLQLNLISSSLRLCAYRQHISGNCDNSNAI